jgi:predicted transcriptional regulator
MNVLCKKKNKNIQKNKGLHVKLKEYLDEKHIEYKGACQDLDISYSTIYNIFNGQFDPRKSFIEKVKRYTRGAVKYQDWENIECPKETISHSENQHC